MVTQPLTPHQTAALAFLATVPAATASQIAVGIGGTQARAAGRVGGRIGRRLVALGLARVVESDRSTIPAYRITREGMSRLPKRRVVWDDGATGPLGWDIAMGLSAELNVRMGPGTHRVEAAP